MKGLEFSLLDLGIVENAESMNLAGLSWATVEDKNKITKWWRLVYNAILVKHPTAGYILYDTGQHLDNPKDRLPQGLKDFCGMFVERDQFVDEALKKCGITVNDINMVIISHGHYDHSGGICFFEGTKAGQNICISRKELEMALLESHSSVEGYANAYFREDYENDNLTYRIVEEGELFPGIELIKLIGHTQGTLGMVLHCEENTYIFPSDAIYCSRNYGPPVVQPGLIQDTKGYWQTIKIVQDLQKKYDAKIIYPHDYAQMKSMKTAPYFYK